MAANMETTQEEGGGKKTSGLITINDLNYALEPDLSVAVNKTHKRHFFQSNEYSNNQRAICILNSGADYIDTRRSYLALDLEVNITPDPLLVEVFEDNNATPQVKSDFYNTFKALLGKHGSSMNIIDNITISTRSGDELCRLNNFALMQNMLIPSKYGRDFLHTNGGLINYGGQFDTQVNGISSRPTKVIIPMHMISPLFGYGRLMPAMLMSGLRIEIGWAQPSTAFILHSLQGIIGVDTTNGQTYPCNLNEVNDTVAPGRLTQFDSFTVKNAYFNLCSIQLSDSIQRALNEQSAVNGLEIVYSDYERTQQAMSNLESNIHLEVRKSCSRALKAFARVQLKDKRRPASRSDSYRAEVGFPFTEYQWQLGSLYFPQQPVKSLMNNDSNLDMAKEAYLFMLEAHDKYNMNPDAGTFLPFDRFVIPCEQGTLQSITSGTNNGEQALTSNTPSIQAVVGSYLLDQHTICVNLERSSLFNLAGVPVNNSRVLALHAKLIANGETYQRSPILRIDVGDTTEPTNEEIPAIQGDRSLFIFLKYVKLARVFLNNVEVEQ
jgi:hypothetical protein